VFPVDPVFRMRRWWTVVQNGAVYIWCFQLSPWTSNINNWVPDFIN
jgi:hypothetical protein